MSKHIPGPYTLKINKDQMADIAAASGQSIVSLFVGSSEPLKATAALFASAPDLYTKVKDFNDSVLQLKGLIQGYEASNDTRAAELLKNALGFFQ